MPPDQTLAILKAARERRAADIHVAAGSPLMFRIGDELQPITKETLDKRRSRDIAYSLLTEEQIATFEKRLDLDIMYVDDDRNRYRVNISYSDGRVGAVIRLLAAEPWPLQDLHLPEVVNRLAMANKGLILITGSTSQGKTTTMASLIDTINHQQRRHIVTIEDPIEYVHESDKSIIRQREVGRDTESFSSGLRAALRQDPDVIAIGEMRDLDTIRIALTAAETGVLVMSTLHIISIDKVIERMLSYAPPEGDGHLRYLLADTLIAAIHQELLPTTDGGKRVAVEILTVTDAARNIIRKRGMFHLRNIISTGQRFGMRSMKVSLDELHDSGQISEALYYRVLEDYR